MNELLSYCGLVCNSCPIYLATREVNEEKRSIKRVEITQLCREQYGMKYEPADITDCDGCRTEDGRLFSGCTDCVIRNCAMQKSIANCAYCTEYVCKDLEAFFAKDPDGKTRLDEVRNRIL